MTTARKKVTNAVLSFGANAVLAVSIYHFVVRPARTLHQVDAYAPVGSRLIDGILPHYEFRAAVTTRIHAAPEQIFAALKQISMADMPAAAAFGGLRSFLIRLITGRAPKGLDQARTQPIIEASRASGNILLAEAPGREIVIGAVGRFHDLHDQQPVKLDNARQFAFFVNPNYQKLAMSWAIVGGNAEQGYDLVMETRTHALSGAARRKFALYWWLMGRWGGDLLSHIVLDAVKRRVA